ncbi:MAG: efflux RND transporter permease subunit [Gammaproteobacteria bacterium]
MVRRYVPVLKKLAVPAILVAASAAAAVWLFLQEPEPPVRNVDPPVLLVDVIPAVPTTVDLNVRAQGTVTPRTQTTLVSEVSGQILEVSATFVSGGFFKAGELLVRIDDRNYRAELKRAEAAVAAARTVLVREQGLADYAKEDWEKLRRSEAATALALRKPQMAEALAQLTFAEADLEKRQGDLARTVIRAPYDGMIREKRADMGQYVSPGTQLAEVFAVDVVEVRLPLPDKDLPHVALDDHPAVHLSASIGGTRHEWDGSIVRTEGVFDVRSRVLHAVAQVQDPYNQRSDLWRYPLRVGTFVDAEIEGFEVASLRWKIPCRAPSCATTAEASMAISAPDDTDHGVIAWFARNHVAANLLMVVIAISGLVSAYYIRIQVNPDVESQSIQITLPYPGASPGEVETGVVDRVEEAVRDIDGIDRMYSRSREGSGTVTLVIENGYDLLAIMDDVKLAVDRIVAMPEQAERPIISRQELMKGAINVQVYGNLDERGLKDLANKVREEILNLPSVTQAELRGARPYEVSIEIGEGTLRRYGLTLARVAQAVRASSIDLGAGSIRTEAGDILLRTQGQAYSRADFERIVLLTEPDGTRLTLGDIATVDDGFVEQNFYSLFNGQPSIGVSVSAVADQNQIEISREVREYVEQKQATLPDGIHVEYWMDSTEYLSATLNMMLSNMLGGALLVILLLGLFLRVQLAFWVMLGIPIAFLGALAVLPELGHSLNMISLFGFILVLGIVVDDAIVIGESVQSRFERHGHSVENFERHGHSVENVILGAKRVAIPATFGVLTTIATFAPMLFVPGNFGAIPASVGWVVILCLAFSLVESKLILPAHLASMKPLPPDDGVQGHHPIRHFQRWFAGGMRTFIRHYYEPLLTRAIGHRYMTAAIFLSVLVLALGFTLSPYVRTVMFPDITADFVRAQVELVDGSASAQTVKVVEEMTRDLVTLNDSLPEHEKFLNNFMAFTFEASGTILIDLKSEGGINPNAVARDWREHVGDIAGTKKLEIMGTQKSHGGTGDVRQLPAPGLGHESAACRR